ncbi:MAG: protein-disulfide reductase DsbD family protein, partial [Hyphomonadaceae bacterium]|nr:protein-disulfide reductase DsbD family protein [Hyphomonadaceae bacterium]
MRALMSWAKKGLAAATLLAAGMATPAQAQVTAKSDHAEGTLVFERSAATPGDTFLGALKLDLADGWHVYWRNPGDSGLPPVATWTPSPVATFGDFRFPAPHAIPLATLMNYGYEHQVVLPFQIQIAADAKPGTDVPIGGKIEYLICADICIPEDIELSTTLRVAASPETDVDGSAIIVATLPHIPVVLTGKASVERTAKGFRIAAADSGIVGALGTAKNIRFFPDGPELSHPAKQLVKTGPEGVSIELTASDFAKEGDQNLSGIIAITDDAGSTRAWEVAATPGPAPAGVADKEFVNVEVSGGAPLPAAADVPMMGVSELLVTLGLAFLGGLVLNLMPCVLPVLTIKAAGLVHTAHNPKESRAHGLAYLGGVVVCFAAIGGILIALRAAGEQAGLGFQLQYPPITAFFALVMFAVGLNLLGVFEIGGSLMGVGSGLAERGGTSGAFFTGLLAAFVGAPCVGPFMAPAFATALAQPAPVVMAVFVMVGIGLAAPFVLLSFTPAFAKVLPKPGRWMETFRQVLAFPMFITVLWLLWVLAGQSGPDGIIAVLAGGIALGFGIWLAKKIGQGMVGRIVAVLVIIAAFVVPSLSTTMFKAEAAAEVSANAWSPEKVAELQAEGRVIFVDFTARWCVTCQFNKSAIHDASVARAFNDLNVAFLEA